MENLIREAITTDLESRKILTIPQKEKFGLEIETIDVPFNEIERLVYNLSDEFFVHVDTSLKDYGAEISTPVYTNTKEELKLLRKLSKTLKHLTPNFDGCSFQVNYDCTLSDIDRMELLKVFGYYEKIISRFSRGNDPKLRESILEYANPIFYEVGFIISSNKSLEDKLNKFTNRKMFAMTYKENLRPHLIEFRTPNGTDDYDLWMNYITAFYYLIDVVKKHKYDKEKIDYTYENFSKLNDDEYFNNKLCFPIHEDLLIEFVNLLFTNKLDKLHFIKQYIGNDEEYIKKLELR